LDFQEEIFIKVTNIKFHGNPSSGGAALIHANRRGDRQTDGHEANSKLKTGRDGEDSLTIEEEEKEKKFLLM